MSNVPRHLYHKFISIDLPPEDAFDGQTVLVTGATTGLGLEAAIHFINCGAKQVVITGRNKEHGHKAKKYIEEATGGKGKGKVRSMGLEMDHYASVNSFVGKLKRVNEGQGGIDYALLNADVVNGEYTRSAEGIEMDIQVNHLSTTLLALLLLSGMKEERKNRSSPAHLGIVNSIAHYSENIRSWPSWIEKDGGVIAHLSKPKSWSGLSSQYSYSKLLNQYAIREIAKLAIGPDGKPIVIVNSNCPGICKTNFTRNLKDAPFVWRIMGSVIINAFAKTAESGARTLVRAGLTTEEDHGKFIKFFGNEEEYKRESHSVIFSEDAVNMQAQVWKETVDLLATKVPKVREIITA